MIEFFAGTGTLTSVARVFGLSNSFGVDKSQKRNTRAPVVSVDLCDEQGQTLVSQWLQSGLVCWVHLAPPCGTASQARNIPTGAKNEPKPLRTSEEPCGIEGLQGTEKLRVDSANKLYEWSCNVFTQCCANNIIVTLENPRSSLFWATPWWIMVQKFCSVFSGDFQACMLGSSRPKWSRFVSNIIEIEQLSIECDGQHQHAPWGKAVCPETGKLVWATSLEAAYPRLLCVAVVQIVLSKLETLNVEMPPASFAHIHEDPNLAVKHLQIVLQKQPRGQRVPPIVPQFSEVKVIECNLNESPPCQLLQKLAQPFQHVPTGSKLLRRTFQGEDSGRVQKLAFGLPWSVEQFVEQGNMAPHPKTLALSLEKDLVETISFNCNHSPWTISKMRISWVKKWIARSAELQPQEKLLFADSPPHVKRIGECKRVLLAKEMLREIGFEDVSALDVFHLGASLVGPISAIPGFPNKFRPALTTVKQLETSAAIRNKATLLLARSSGDCELDARVWQETCSEIQRGWLEGPYELSSLEHGAVISHRFGLLQRNRTKLRLIDDFTVSGVNQTVQLDSKPSLHTINTFCAMIQKWFQLRASSHVGGLVAKTFDLSAAYRQIPICEEHRKFAYVCVFNPGAARPAIFRLTTMPFGATHSVFAFLRLSRQIHALACRALRIPLTNFYDDFIMASAPELSQSCSSSMEVLFNLLGWAYAKEGDKATTFGPTCQALGVVLDFDRSADGVLKVSNTPNRVQDIQATISEILSANLLSPALALQLRGRLGFTENFVMGRCGSWTLKLLVEHAYQCTSFVPSPELRDSLSFMLERLSSNLSKEVKSSAAERFTIYCDASFEGGSGGIGAVLYNASGSCISWFGVKADEDFCSAIAEGRETVIFDLEMCAVFLAIKVWQSYLTNSDSVIFTDNEGVKFSLIKGSCDGLFASYVLRCILDLEFQLDTNMWYSRVPSESNIADFPSRFVQHPSLLQSLHTSFPLEAALSDLVTHRPHRGIQDV